MYEQDITRERPTSFIFVVDQSSSMAHAYGNMGVPKSLAVANALNRLMQEMIHRARKNEIKHLYDFAVIGYGATVGPILHGSSPGNELVPVKIVADQALRVTDVVRKVPDGAGGLVEETVKMAVWVEPASNGHTPMFEAFEQVLAIAEKAARRYPKSYPPTVIHITDGEFTTADPSPLMTRLKQISTDDGNALLFNIHISSSGGSVFLPSSAAGVPDAYAQMLFDASSVLPPGCQMRAGDLGVPVTAQSRAFAFNADPVQFINLLAIGTQPLANLCLPAGNIDR